MQEYYVVKDGQIIADELTLSEVLEYQRFHGYSLTVHERNYSDTPQSVRGLIALIGLLVFAGLPVVAHLNGWIQ